MKIDPGLRPYKQEPIRGGLPGPVASTPSFSQFLHQERETATREEIMQRIALITKQGERLARSMTVRDLREYKNLIRKFLDDTVRKGVGLKETRGRDRRARTKRYQILAEIDRALLSMADELLTTESGRIELLARIGEIRGLLINLSFDGAVGMAFRDIVGQERIKEMLRRAVRNNALSHAYLFEGPAGSGRRAMARALAQYLFCSAGGGDDACGACSDCRKLLHGNHTDFLWIEPEGASVKIDQIRELQRQFSHRSTGGRPRVYVIDEADRLTTQAANALLKFLEEPSGNSLAILIAESGRALLPTILSRVQRLAFHPMSPDEMARELMKESLPAPLVRLAVRMASGVEAARELIQLNWFAEVRNTVLQLAQESQRGFPAAAVAAQAALGKGEVSEHLEALFDVFLLWLRDMIVLKQNGTGSVVFIDQKDWMGRLAASRPASHWIQSMDEALRAKRRLRGHANPQLVLERFLFALQGGTSWSRIRS